MSLTKGDLKAIDNLIEKRTTPIDRRLSSLEKNQKEMKKDIKLIVKSFDRDHLSLQKRVGKIEKHLNISPAN